MSWRLGAQSARNRAYKYTKTGGNRAYCTDSGRNRDDVIEYQGYFLHKNILISTPMAKDSIPTAPRLMPIASRVSPIAPRSSRWKWIGYSVGAVFKHVWNPSQVSPINFNLPECPRLLPMLPRHSYDCPRHCPESRRLTLQAHRRESGRCRGQVWLGHNILLAIICL